MRRVYSLVGAILLVGCMDSSSSTEPRLPGAVVTNGASLGKEFGGGDDDKRQINTRLTSAEEPPITSVTPNIIVTSDAHGMANFQLSKDGLSMDYVLVVNNINNVTQAHIHMAAKGVNGGIVVWLFPSVTSTAALTPPGTGPHTGLLAKGTFTAANLRGALANQPLSALVAAIAAGNAYVNVHTNDGGAAQNTGAGDFPGGEIRGQLDHNGH